MESPFPKKSAKKRRKIFEARTRALVDRLLDRFVASIPSGDELAELKKPSALTDLKREMFDSILSVMEEQKDAILSREPAEPVSDEQLRKLLVS